MAVLLLVGLAIRLIYIQNQGFRNDVVTFEAWAISLVDHGYAAFYSKTSFADYPPGYFYVLGMVGSIWNALFRAHDGGYAVLAAMVKLPAILADLGVGWLVYAIGCRFAPQRWAFAAAAIYVLNPVTIFISALWGQIDSLAGGLALLAAYFLLKSEDGESDRPSLWIVGAWVVFAYSLLIKPQSAVLIPIFIAFALVKPAFRRARITATAIGIGAAFVLTYALSVPFHSGNPVAVFGWLLHQYEFGSSVYSFNSVNAFNLWAIKGTFWVPDSNLILGLPQVIWGTGLVLAALGLIVWRYLYDRTPQAMLESCAVSLLAFFILATRMHERYMFDGLLFAIACIPLARRYLWGVAVLSVVLFANLKYSLDYLTVMNAHTPGIDPHNVWGPITSVYSLFAVGTFFVLGYLFLGGPASETAWGNEVASAPQGPRGMVPPGQSGFSGRLWPSWLRPADWFDPSEGLRAMRAPLDYIVMGAIGVGTFILSFVNYAYPSGKIFDEIYFARAAEEYLQNLRIYENTHPPFSKLLVTLSVMLFGGMPHGHGLGGWTGLNAIIGHMPNGDNSYGWRFLDVVFGALVVMLLYAFAKRITGSTVFAAIAAVLLSLDGMHFVQSRIATPEGFVVFFSLLAVYAFYRFWIASQTNERVHVNVPPLAFALGALASLVFGGLFLGVWKLLVPPPNIASPDFATSIITVCYASLGAYLLVRYVAFPRIFSDGRIESTFGEGSYALRDEHALTMFAADGGVLDTATQSVQRGERSQVRNGELAYGAGAPSIAYHRDGSVEYRSPFGEATYANNRTTSAVGSESGRSARLWLVLFTIALGLLVSAKWYGVMGFGVSFLVLIGIWLQRIVFTRRPTLWGNPRGFRLDGALIAILFVSASVYALVWTPDLMRHAPGDIQNFNDVVYRQYTMFEYHDTLKATHPYSSKWWEWPLDYVPIAYYYQDHRANQQDPKACCVTEITSMPNPLNMWFGLLCVPLVGYLAWRERNKGYALIVVTYLLQWLPWMKSPRITFAYHFYVDIPLICLCNAIVLQRVWQYGASRGKNGRLWGGIAVGGYVALIAGAFVFFYPILAASPITWQAWHARMWFSKWIVGPG